MAKKIDLAEGLTHFKAKENASIAITEATSTASAPHKAGEYFYYKGDLVIATADIAQGGTITLNTNCKKQPLADSVCELKTALTALEPTATSSDIGKALIAKTVADGKVTEYEFGEAGGGEDTETKTINNAVVAHFTDGANANFDTLIVDIIATQSGSGNPSSENIRPFTPFTEINLTKAKKNLFDGTLTNGRINNGVYVSTNTYKCSGYIKVPPNTKIRVSKYAIGEACNTYISEFDKNKAFIKTNSPASLITTNEETEFIRFHNTATVINDLNGQITVSIGKDIEDYEQYTATVSNITLPNDAGNVYGATENVKTGAMLVTWGHIASYNGETLPGLWLSDRDVYEAGTTPTTGAEVIYELENPIAYSVTPLSISSFDGLNNVWADCGNIHTITYVCNVSIFDQIDLVKSIIANVEESDTATQAYTVNDFLIIDNTLYIVTANIANGGTITVGTNVTATTIGEQITAILNS